MSVGGPVVTKRSIWYRLYHGETNIDFVGPFRRWVAISGVVIVVGLISLGVRGLNLGIDFEGGVVWEVPAGDATVADVQADAEGQGLDNVTVQELEADGVRVLRVKAAPVDNDTAQQVSARLAEVTGSTFEDVSLNSVGPSWGAEISKKALRALILFLIAITIYISFRFEWKMALPTLAALVHDILVTVGVYSICGFEVTPATVIAVLTILGFSIYDGIVVFDKVDENTRLVGTSSGLSYAGMVNLSLNQVLMRSLNTSITALLPVASLLILGSFVMGATTLQEFALALLIGLAAGAYSSIFIASPMLAVLKEREPRYRDLARRLEARQGGPSPVVGSAVGTVAAGGDATGVLPELSGRVIPPRPRKKGRRR
ncbi:MAG: protein translocase subunit SecF [Acidimicrobiia bacterium]